MTTCVTTVLTPAQAQEQGFHVLSGPYSEDERWMLDRAIASLAGGRREYRLVSYTPLDPNVVELWTRLVHPPAGSLLHAE